MPELTLSQAAKLIGKSKSTLNRAIKSGRLSAIRNDDGTFSINPAELLRAFPGGVPRLSSERLEHGAAERVGTAEEPTEINALRAELAKAEQRAAVAEAQATAFRELADDRGRHIEDLRRMLPAPSPPPVHRDASDLQPVPERQQTIKSLFRKMFS